MNSNIDSIKIIAFDIDGVLTDGNMYIDQEGLESKRFRLTEIDAINSIRDLGIEVIAITGEDTPIVDYFAKKITWKRFIRGCKDKKSALEHIISELGIKREEIAYIGDGKYDIEAIIYAGYGLCPANAIEEVKDVADIVLEGYGGESCIYELYRWIANG